MLGAMADEPVPESPIEGVRCTDCFGVGYTVSRQSHEEAAKQRPCSQKHPHSHLLKQPCRRCGGTGDMSKGDTRRAALKALKAPVGSSLAKLEAARATYLEWEKELKEAQEEIKGAEEMLSAAEGTADNARRRMRQAEQEIKIHEEAVAKEAEAKGLPAFREKTVPAGPPTRQEKLDAA